MDISNELLVIAMTTVLIISDLWLVVIFAYDSK